MSKGPVSQFIEHHYRHFNAAALVDAAKGYETHLLEGGKMLVSLAGAMMFISKLFTQSIGPNWDIAGMVIFLMITLLVVTSSDD